MGWLDLFKKKKIQCSLCKNKEYKNKTWVLQMNTAEGPHAIHVCDECATVLKNMENQKDLWLNKMMED